MFLTDNDGSNDLVNDKDTMELTKWIPTYRVIDVYLQYNYLFF